METAAPEIILIYTTSHPVRRTQPIAAGETTAITDRCLAQKGPPREPVISLRPAAAARRRGPAGLRAALQRPPLPRGRGDHAREGNRRYRKTNPGPDEEARRTQ